MPVVSRRRRIAEVAAWSQFLLFAGAGTALLVSGLRGAPALLAFAGVAFGLLPFLAAQATERWEIGQEAIVVVRRPLPRLVVTLDAVQAIEKFTLAQWFVRLHGRRRPIVITLRWLVNSQEIERALLGFADRSGVAVVESAIFVEETESGRDCR